MLTFWTICHISGSPDFENHWLRSPVPELENISQRVLLLDSASLPSPTGLSTLPRDPGFHRAETHGAGPSESGTDGEAPAVSQEVALHCMIQAALLAYRTGWVICIHPRCLAAAVAVLVSA